LRPRAADPGCPRCHDRGRWGRRAHGLGGRALMGRGRTGAVDAAVRAAVSPRRRSPRCRSLAARAGLSTAQQGDRGRAPRDRIPLLRRARWRPAPFGAPAGRAPARCGRVVGRAPPLPALAAGLARRPALAIFAVTIVAALQPAHAATPSYEWGSDYFQRRAAFFVGRLKQDLRLRHPEFPSHSRLYFVGVPNGTGIGEPWFNPAFRVWYRDSTLTGDLYRRYVPRGAG